MNKLVFTASILAIAISVVGLSGTSVLYLKGDFKKPTKPSPIACVPCSMFVKLSNEGSNPDILISKLTTLEEDGVQMCCAFDSDQMSNLLELAMRRPEIERDSLPEFDPNSFRFSYASVHKRLVQPSIHRSTVPVFEKSSLVTTLFNTESDPLTEHVHEVQVMNDGLKILHSGQYMIYSNIHFRPDSTYPCKNFKYQVWGHYINRTRQDDPRASGCILKTSHTCCDNCTRDDETSFTSGVFNLIEGDIIRIAISGHGLVYFGKQSSFAGLVMLGDRYPNNGQV